MEKEIFAFYVVLITIEEYFFGNTGSEWLCMHLNGRLLHVFTYIRSSENIFYSFLCPLLLFCLTLDFGEGLLFSFEQEFRRLCSIASFNSKC
jgi:hypothetical protein